MPSIAPKATPLVSVIIPCFNHGKYLMDALESIWSQKYPAIEIIVVDDGSTDNTKEILKDISEIKYVKQRNQGLSAARNTGIKNSSGEFLVFLDADDWLLEYSIEINVSYLLWNDALAFVSGAHKKAFADNREPIYVSQEVNADHYLHLLQGNYIGMNATVMFRRWVFNDLSFDESLKACEDYDIYLKVARKFPVFHHTHYIAAYRIHNSNMSGNIPLMLSSVLKVLKKQKKKLTTSEEKQAYENGYDTLNGYYSIVFYKELLSNKNALTSGNLYTLFRYNLKLGVKFILKYTMQKLFIKKRISLFGKKQPNKPDPNNFAPPAIGDVKTGDFNRLTPFSTEFGYDRGGPVDRYYIENFLVKEAENIKGRCLEIGDNEYSLSYGGNKLTQSDILHIDETNPKATFIGDLSNAPQLPDNAFDCIVLTQTLHLIYDFKAALATCNRILKPGGVLLLTTPGITPIDHGTWKKTWYWSFTDTALIKLFAETFPDGQVDIETFGNVYVATAFLFGMGITEVPKEKMDYHDPHFQVIITVKAIKRMVDGT